MTEEKIMRINELAHLSKTRELTPEEKEEQLMLRKEFLASIRRSVKQQLDSIEFVEDSKESAHH